MVGMMVFKQMKACDNFDESPFEFNVLLYVEIFVEGITMYESKRLKCLC